MPRRLVVGGLGGGGDVGLAAILVESWRIQREVAAVVSFARCRTGKRGVGKRVAGALVRVEPGDNLGPRVFEDKLARIAEWAHNTFLLCTEDPWSNIMQGVKWVVQNIEPTCFIHTDIGGDSLLLGYETMLGSYTVDTVARATLTTLAKQYSIPTYIAAGGIGAEGGGVELNPIELATTLETLLEAGAIKGSWTPQREDLYIAKKLLNQAASGMLPLYNAAVEGAKKTKIHKAYLHGEYEIKPWYKHVIIIDTTKHCNLSPLCKNAIGRGTTGIRKWTSTPPKWYQTKLKKLRKTAEAKRNPDHILVAIFDKILKKKWTPSKC